MPAPSMSPSPTTDPAGRRPPFRGGAWLFSLSFGLCLGLGGGVAPAQAPLSTAGGPGDLLVAPARLIFEGRKRTAELNLSNIGFAPATYGIALVRMEMDEDGRISERPLDTTPGAVSLPGLLRFSPREVLLGPQESQTVRIQVRKPANLPAGEYRIYMAFRGLPPVAEPAGEAGPQPAPRGLSIRLVPLYSLAIPLIVRHGPTSAKVALSDLAFDVPSRTLRLRLDRQGNQSVYGDLKVHWLPRARAAAETARQAVLLAEASGLAVYVPNARRAVSMALAAPKGAGGFGPGRLKVTYVLPPPEGGAVLAEAFLDLP